MIKNIIANTIGRFWSILSNYIFIPLYISLLGIENYAVISFTFILIGVMSVMDAGLTATLSREFAKQSEENSASHKLRTLNTLELCYWVITIIVILVVLIFARPITEKWITLKTLDVNNVIIALKFFGVAMALQLLGNFYLGGLIGLEQQVKANVFQVIWGVFRNGLVLLVILFKPSLIYFFAWQAIVTFLYVILLRYALIKSIKRNMPVFDSFVFDKKILGSVSKFIGGMLLISMVAAVNTQLDKIAISKMLPIEELGYYNLGISLTQVLLVLVTPIAIALLPRFTLLYSQEKNQDAERLFYVVTLFVSILIFSIAGNIMFNAKELIFAWTGNSALALSTSKYIIYLAFGTAMLAMQVIPFNIAIANGYTKINNILGISSLFVSIPGYWMSVYYFGPKGAAITWCILQTVTTPLYLFYIHKRFLERSSYFTLLSRQIFKPAIAALVIAFFLSLILPHLNSRMFQLMLIGLSTLITLSVVVIISLTANELRLYSSMVKEKFLLGGRLSN